MTKSVTNWNALAISAASLLLVNAHTDRAWSLEFVDLAERLERSLPDLHESTAGIVREMLVRYRESRPPAPPTAAG